MFLKTRLKNLKDLWERAYFSVEYKLKMEQKGRFGSATGNRTRVLRLRISRPNP
jgi:hypothetical protein